VSATGWQVTCADGAVRHPAPFATRADAALFAEWGHVCLAEHTFARVAIEVPHFPTMSESARQAREAWVARQASDLGNTIRREGVDRCLCGCKYWEHDRCIDCGGTEVVVDAD
jgi:hypothetical protein